MKKFLFALCGLLFTFNANAGQMANVEYIHQLIKQEHGIDIKYAPDLISPRQAANMKYLLTAVDVANEILNGKKTTDYGNGEFATRVAVDTTATIQAVHTLIKQDYKFFITTTPDTTEFSFKIQASGEFVVDWGDGKTEKIVKNDTSNQTYSHTYTTADEYTIKMGGKATGYSDSAAISFAENTNLATIDGSLGKIFSTLSDGTNPRFGSFEEGTGLFMACTNLTSIPETLFTGITGAPAVQMFTFAFNGCTGLTSIPEKLFAGITGAPAAGMFFYTFLSCSGLTSIPENLFASITGAPAEMMFAGTFYYCSSITSIPEKLFASITGTPAEHMFLGTFAVCSSLTSIPENLFAGITGAPAKSMFSHAFVACSALTKIPEKLFAGITGVPASEMFSQTFSGCTGLTSIPEKLFAGIKGAPAESMFDGTFRWCTGLTSIPENLFAGITGAPAESMFGSTFEGCSNLSGYIPPKLFAGIDTDTTADSQMSYIFDNTGLDTVCPSGTVQYITGFESWFNGKVSCEPFEFEPKFTATTTPDTTTFSFDISAAGRFLVDWGDGSDVQVITRTSTSSETYSHKYATADEYQIKIDGKATGYGSNMAISFYENKNLAKIDGSLGQIFGTLSDGTQPRFGSKQSYNYRGTFKGCTNLTGEIPAELFSGITGAPASYMFYNTFCGCSGLTGSIPENLFAGITGAPAEWVFGDTFYDCSGLSGNTPENLFAGVSGAPASYMFSGTFSNCSGLSGSIPENLFAGIKGAPAERMFAGTFYGCSGLSGNIPENLFAGVSGAPAYAMFSNTFCGCSGLTGSIPANLFAGVSGAPADWMFGDTFCYCSGLSGYIPPKLFAGIGTDTTATNQMLNVFSGTGLDTTCPAGTIQYTTGFESWFDGRVSCEPFVFEPKFTATTTPDTTEFSFKIQASGEFFVDWGDGAVEQIVKNDTSNQTYTHTYDTPDEYTIKMGGKATGYTTGGLSPSSSFSTLYFPTASNITKIDGSLGEIFGTLPDGTNPIFLYTFQNAKFTTIPETLFHGITTESKSQFAYWYMFGKSELSTIPENLFTHTNRFSFQGMFGGCTKLTSIPKNLFAGITGAPAERMFYNTFSGCTGLTGPIPENLFAGIKGAPASSMFNGTFNGCSNLSGNIPENLFAGIKGTPATGMFLQTFYGCSGLTGSIPENLFAGITGAPASRMFENTFWGCSGLTGYIPPKLFADISTDTTASNQMLNVFSGTGLDTTCPAGTIQYTTGFESWFSGKVSCEPYVPNATLTTTTNPGRFIIRMTAIGNFTIDWGDGNIEKITRHDTNDTEYWHDYGNADQSYSIKITGRATGYSDDPYRAAISFRENTQLAYVNGELGEIFPTLDDGTQPGFYETFYGCTGMTEISPTLFAGISGAPRARMFGSTFRKCSSLTEIPADLFANITGNPAANVFDATFQECYNLTTIPENLFGGIYGTPAPEMFMRTFHNCSGLTSIPENLFGNISGTSANNMFNNMFEGCSNLTGYSARINGEFLYNIWPNIQTWAYVGCNKLTDYSTMPNSWK